MYCRDCGNEVGTNAVACPKCGADPRTEKNFCPSCGTATNANQVMCINCGASLAVAKTSVVAHTAAQDNSKTVAIVAHLTVIGWIIALILNSQNKSEFGSFHIRNMLGLIIFNFIGIFTIPLFLIGWIIMIFNFVVWLISFINAINNKTEPLLVYGSLFQGWFKGM